MAPCALPRHTFPGSEDVPGSLLSILQHLHKPYLFTPLGPGEGQILWRERRSLQNGIQNGPLNRYFEV